MTNDPSTSPKAMHAASADAAPDALSGPSPALLRALRKLLRPLVRLMLARGIPYTYLTELLKGLFVEVADREFGLDNKPPTDSRISLVSGVHRKDVSRLRQLQQTAQTTEPAVVSLGSQVVARWLAAPPYVQDDGKPRPLARMISEGGDLSFEALVSSINNDIRSRVVLDEWMRLGVVHLDDEERICLNTEAFVPSRNADEKAFYLGHNLHDHACAAVNNLLGGAPLMDRSVHYTELSAASVQQLAQLSEKLGMQALLAVNKCAMQAEAKDQMQAADNPTPRQRMTFGVYFYTEPLNNESGAQDTSRRDTATGDTP